MEKKRIFGFKDLVGGFNVVTELSKPVNLFTKDRGTFTIYQQGEKVKCNFDFGWVGSDYDLKDLFCINLETDEINFVFSKFDKRFKKIGSIKEIREFLGGPTVYRAFINDISQQIECLIPKGDGVKWLGDIYIHLKDPLKNWPLRINLQLALFEVMPERERYLVFSYIGESLKRACYFLAIKEKTLENPYQGIGLFF